MLRGLIPQRFKTITSLSRSVQIRCVHRRILSLLISSVYPLQRDTAVQSNCTFCRSIHANDFLHNLNWKWFAKIIGVK